MHGSTVCLHGWQCSRLGYLLDAAYSLSRDGMLIPAMLVSWLPWRSSTLRLGRWSRDRSVSSVSWLPEGKAAQYVAPVAVGVHN